MKTVLITGASSGIGKETALFFHKQGWNVAASMRSPEKTQGMEHLFCPRLDVTDAGSVKTAVEQTLTRFGQIDVLVNNAGYALVGPFEWASNEQIRRQFETNVLGLMETTRAVVPHFRERKEGTIINIASVGGHMTFPLYSLYHATKWSVEGFSESLQTELALYGIKVKIVEPGPIKTDFYSRSADPVSGSSPQGETLYREYVRKGKGNMDRAVHFMGSSPLSVAKVIYTAASDGRKKLRYPAGWAARPLLYSRKIVPVWLYNKIVQWVTLH